MTVLSCLRAPAIAGARAVFAASRKTGQISIVKVSMPVRFMSGDRQMVVSPSRYMYNVLKDQFHYYIFLGLLIWATPMMICYIRYGPAELADIPEGYVPKAYEYYQNPIVRWLQKTFEPSYEKVYERNLSILEIKFHKKQCRQLTKRVKQLMREKQDYEGWYYKPHNVSYVNANEFEDKMRRRLRSTKS